MSYTIYAQNKSFPNETACFTLCSAESLESNKKFIRGRIAIMNRPYAKGHKPWKLVIEERKD